MMKATTIFLAMLAALMISFTIAHAAGQNEGEQILDSQGNMNWKTIAADSWSAATSVAQFGISYGTGIVQGVRTTSNLMNTLAAQDLNKQNAQNQNTEVTAAQADLDNAKENMTQMFFYIVGTFIVLFDMILSIISIAVFSFIIWLVFIGYVRFMVVIIDFAYGKSKLLRGKA